MASSLSYLFSRSLFNNSKCVLKTLSPLSFIFSLFLCLIKQQVQFNSVTRSCPTLCNPMNHHTPGLSVHHQFEFTQTQVHWVGDAIQPSHPLFSPSPPAPNPSQHQGFFFPMSQLFSWRGQSIGVSVSALVLPVNTQDWSPSGWTGWISLKSMVKS